MRTIAWLIRSRVRARSAVLAVIAVVTALGAAGTLVAAGAADRTASAYSRYLDRADVGDVVINPSLVSRDIDRAIRTLPGVESVTSSSLFLGAIYDGPPPTKAKLDNDPSGALILGSVDGRHTRMDRPVLVDGRMTRGRREIVVDTEAARDEHLHVGDVVPLSLWSRRGDLIDPPDTVEKPIGVEHVTVVGIATFADEVLPDGVYPRARVIVSPDLAARYACLPALPAGDASPQQLVAAMAPDGCAVSYNFYSLRVRGGDRGVNGVLAEFARRSDALTAALPKTLRSFGATYTLVGKTRTHDDLARVQRSNTPITVALVVLAIAAGLITIAILGLVLARELGRARNEQLAWWRLGFTRRERWAVVVAPLLVAVGIGLAVAVLLAWLCSPVAPIGAVRSIDPSPAREISTSAWLTLLILAATLVVLAASLAYRSSRRLGNRPARAQSSAVRRILRPSNRPDVDDGVRAAYGTNRGSGLVIALAGSAVAVFLAAIVFGSSLTSLISTPASYGWPWDVGVIGNFGYGGLDDHAIATSLDDSRAVRSWTALGFSNAIALDGDAVPALFGVDRVSAFDVAVVAGRLPTAGDEIALGSRTAAERDLHVGERVTVAGFEVTPRHATVTAIVVLPSLGPFQGDRASPGRGILLPAAMVKPSAVRDELAFVGVRFAPGVDRTAALAGVRRASASWGPKNVLVARYSQPVRPPEIVNARSVRRAPFLVAGLLVLAATLGLAAGIITSVRSRRHETAVLRTLGFTGRQLRVSVRVQALAMMFGGFVVGAPIGIIIGRLAWRTFASRLGVVTDPSTPVWWIVATALVAALVALVAAAGPARVAARATAAASLRVE